MIDIITQTGAIVGIFNSLLFLSFLVSKRVRRFMVRMVVSDLIIDLMQDRTFKHYIDILCTVKHVVNGSASTHVQNIRGTVKEMED